MGLPTQDESIDLDHFVMEAGSVMRDRLDHGARKFGALSWRTSTYTDDDNARRLDRAVNHLNWALRSFRRGIVDAREVQRRASDVANQAFMLADPSRRHE